MLETIYESMMELMESNGIYLIYHDVPLMNFQL